LYAKDITAYNFFQSPLNFQVNGIEHNISTEAVNIDDVSSNVNYGSWLSFVIPIDSIELPKLMVKSVQEKYSVNVPLPLRSFPNPLHLKKLTQVQSSITGVTAADIVEEIRQWALEAGYVDDNIAQDELIVTVNLNEKANASGDFTDVAGSQVTLLEALVAFKSSYPILQGVYKANEMTSDSHIPAQTGNLESALESLATIVNNVANAQWPNLAGGQQALTVGATTGLSQYSSSYRVESRKQQTTNDLVIRVESMGAVAASPIGFIPQVHIEGCQLEYQGYTAATGTDLAYVEYKYKIDNAANYLTYVNASISPYYNRSVVIQPNSSRNEEIPLDVLIQQNGNVEFQILRNADMGIPSEFYYTSSNVSFKNPLIPFVVHGTFASIDVSELGTSPGTRTINEHLTAMFDALLTVGDGSITVDGYYQAVVDFSYPSTTTRVDLPAINIPLLFELPQALVYGAPGVMSTMIDKLGNAIYGALSDGNISLQDDAKWGSAFVTINVTLYASDDYAVGKTPILNVQSFQIPYSKIAPKG